MGGERTKLTFFFCSFCIMCYQPMHSKVMSAFQWHANVRCLQVTERLKATYCLKDDNHKWERPCLKKKKKKERKTQIKKEVKSVIWLLMMLLVFCLFASSKRITVNMLYFIGSVIFPQWQMNKTTLSNRAIVKNVFTVVWGKTVMR